MFEYFNFGPKFLSILMVLYNKLEMCTINNGWLSKFFQKGRGINQGCPASPLVYSYCGEILNHLLMLNNKVNGVPFDLLKNFLSQFADDTCAFLKYEKLCIEEFSKVLLSVEQQMGLKVSYDKTTMYRIGSLQDSDASIYTSRQYKWSSEAISTLGVYLNCDGSINTCNFADIITKLNSVCNSWINRQLTLTGRILVVNTLMGSLFVYKMLSLENMPGKYLKEAKDIIVKYIWKGKRPKISWSMLIRKKNQGGMRLIDLESKQLVCKMMWIFRLENNPFLANCAFNQLCNIVREKIWCCNLFPKDIKKIFDVNSLWGQVLLAWSKINAQEFFENVHDIKNQIIWWNSNIRINDSPFVWKEWVEKDIWFLEDLVLDGRIRDHNDLGVNWLDWASLVNALTPLWRQWIKSSCVSNCRPLIDQFRNVKNLSRILYNRVIDDEYHPVKYVRRWRDEEDIIIQLNELQDAFERIESCTNTVKLRDFQYRLNLKKVFTNIEYVKWGLSETEHCNFCNIERETISHLLFKCRIIQPLMDVLNEILKENELNGCLNCKNYLFNQVLNKREHVFNYLCINVKQFIFRCRCQDTRPTVETWYKELYSKYERDCFIARREHKTTKFEKLWSPICKSTQRIFGI